MGENDVVPTAARPIRERNDCRAAMPPVALDDSSAGDVFFCAQAFAANAEVVSRYNYDAEGKQRTADRHVAVLTPPDRGQEGGLTRSYYDAYGRRVMRTWLSQAYSPGIESRTDEHHERYVWDGSQILYEIRAYANGSAGDNDNASTAELGRVGYVHGPGIDRPLEAFRSDAYFTAAGYLSDRLFLYADYRGSINLGASSDGSLDRDRLVDSTIVPAFVDWTSRNQSTYRAHNVAFNLSNLNFFGSLLSDQTDGSKLQYLRNRFHDPQTGRFTQEDPLGIAGGLNLYGFGGGDPINFEDPFGLCKKHVADGTICLDLFIRTRGAFAWRGDNREHDPNAPASASRVQIYVNPGNILKSSFVASPSCWRGGSGCHAPSATNHMSVSGGDGAASVSFEFANSRRLGPIPNPDIDGALSFKPLGSGLHSVGGAITAFPSHGIYQMHKGIWTQLVPNHTESRFRGLMLIDWMPKKE